MTRYRLCSHVEEFHCPECGAPVYYGEHAVEHDGDCYCSRHCAELAAAAVFGEPLDESARNRLETSPDALKVRPLATEPEPDPPAEPIRRPVAHTRAVLAVSCSECGANPRTKCQDRTGYRPKAKRYPCDSRASHAATVEGMKRRGVWSPAIPPATQQTLFDDVLT